MVFFSLLPYTTIFDAIWDTTPRQPAGHYGKWPNWANALEQPPASLRGGLREGPQISVWV